MGRAQRRNKDLKKKKKKKRRKKECVLRGESKGMFFSGRTKKDYGSSKRGNDDQEDLLAKLAAERLERQQKRNTERLVVLVQSVCRRNSAVRAARAMFREHFDKHVAAALSSRDAALSDRLVREFAFFAQGSSEDSTDSKRLVLVAALLRERTEAPLSLARPVSTLMAREVLPLSVAGAACKLLLLAMSGRIPDGWKAARFVFENLAKCFSLYPSLQTMFVAIASAPVQRAAWLRPLFVRHVLVVRNVLTNLPPQMLPNVVAAIGDIDGLTNDQALGVVGNLAFLVAGNHFNSRVVSALGSVLPTVVNQIFPFAAMLDRQSEDSDDDNDDNDEDQPKALAVPDDVLLVQNQLLLLTSSKTARLLLSSGLNHLTGICAVYALLLKFVPVQDSDRVRNLVFQSPDILVSLWSLLTCDDAHIQAFVAGSPQPTGFSSVLFIFCELYCRYSQKKLQKKLKKKKNDSFEILLQFLKKRKITCYSDRRGFCPGSHGCSSCEIGSTSSPFCCSIVHFFKLWLVSTRHCSFAASVRAQLQRNSFCSS